MASTLQYFAAFTKIYALFAFVDPDWRTKIGLYAWAGPSKILGKVEPKTVKNASFELGHYEKCYSFPSHMSACWKKWLFGQKLNFLFFFGSEHFRCFRARVPSECTILPQNFPLWSSLEEVLGRDLPDLNPSLRYVHILLHALIMIHLNIFGTLVLLIKLHL